MRTWEGRLGVMDASTCPPTLSDAPSAGVGCLVGSPDMSSVCQALLDGTSVRTSYRTQVRVPPQSPDMSSVCGL